MGLGTTSTAAPHSNGLQIFEKDVDGIFFTVKTPSPKKASQLNCCKCVTHLVLLHGWMGTSNDMSEVADSLLSADGVFQDCCTAILLDLPYHGRSVNVSPSNMPAAADAICHSLSVILSSLPSWVCSGVPLSLLGYSLGGRIALEMYTRSQLSISTFSHSFSLHSLILLSSAPPPSEMHREAIRNQSTKTAATLSSLATASQFETWMRSSWYVAPMWGSLSRDACFNGILKRRTHGFSLTQSSAWSEAVVNLDRTSMTMSQQRQTVSSTPVLFMYGEDDVKYASFTPTFQSIFPSFQTSAIPSAGHNVIAQSPQAVVSEVGSFLGSSFTTGETGSSRVIVEHVRTMKYSLPLVRPMKVGTSVLHCREGLLVSIETDVGTSGIGDVCPLQGLHTQTIADVEDELNRFSTWLRSTAGRSFCIRCVSLTDLDRFTDSLSATARCGIECALVCVFASSSGTQTDEFIARLIQPVMDCKRKFPFPDRSGVIHINGVLPRYDNPKEQQKHLGENRYLSYVLNSPFRTVKLKVGSVASIVDDARAVAEAAKACVETHKTLRLDANRAWELNDYLQFEDNLGDYASSIEFIEEPVKNGSQLHELMQRCKRDKSNGKLAIALDESLDDQPLDSIRALASHCTALVVKPAVAGGLRKTLQLCEIASESGCTVIISSVFDSGVGLAWDAFIASVCDNLVNSLHGSRLPCHGLGTFSYMATDVGKSGFAQHCVRRDGVTVGLAQCHEFLECMSQRLRQAQSQDLGKANEIVD